MAAVVRGSVRFLAHHGLLDVLIKDPEIVVGPERGVLARTRRGDELLRSSRWRGRASDDGDLVWAGGAAARLERRSSSSAPCIRREPT